MQQPFSPDPFFTPNPSALPEGYNLGHAIQELERVRTFLIEQEHLKLKMMDEYARTIQGYEDQLSGE